MTTDLQSALAAYGEIQSVDVLSEKTGDTGEAAEAVYRVSFDDPADRGVLYVREVAEERLATLRRGLAVDGDIGIPNSELVSTDPPLLVMDPASGRPLSTLLPLFFLPGCWWYVKSPLQLGTRELGRCIGRLHTQTRQTTAVPTEHPEFRRYTTYSERFEEYLDGKLLGAIEDTIESLAADPQPVSCVFSDPTPHNLYYSDGQIELIDFTFYDNLAVKDVIAFRRGIELMAGRLPYGRASQAGVLFEAFHDGYRETGPEIAPASLLEYQIVDYAYILNRYLTGALGGSGASLTQQIARRTDVGVCLERLEQLTERRSQVYRTGARSND